MAFHSDMTASRTKVCCRIRPIVKIDEDMSKKISKRHVPTDVCVTCQNDGQTIQLRDRFDVKNFRVDHAFDQADSQVHIYRLAFQRDILRRLSRHRVTNYLITVANSVHVPLYVLIIASCMMPTTVA